MRAATFAAWRELNRFMVVNSDFELQKIDYVEGDPDFCIQPKSRLFDACYLLDGKRGGTPIADEAKYGVFPMISEVISAIMDDKAGTSFTQHITYQPQSRIYHFAYCADVLDGGFIHYSSASPVQARNIWSPLCPKDSPGPLIPKTIYPMKKITPGCKWCRPSSGIGGSRWKSGR